MRVAIARAAADATPEVLLFTFEKFEKWGSPWLNTCYDGKIFTFEVTSQIGTDSLIE